MELKDTPVRWIDATNCDIEHTAKKNRELLFFSNTSYRQVYNLCWDMSGLNDKDLKEKQRIPYPLPNNIGASDKTKMACRYILGLDVPTDIDDAIALIRDAAGLGDENTAKILKGSKSLSNL